MKRAKSRYGFTLVELIVVIAILGILAGIGAVAYRGYVRHANRAADHQLLSSVNKAFAMVCAENGVSPADTVKDAKLDISDEKCIVGISWLQDGDDNEYSADSESDAARAVFELLNQGFLYYFAGNASTPLKYYETAKDFKFEGGIFIPADGTVSSTVTKEWNGFSLTFQQADIDTFNNSKNLSERIGVKRLVNQVDALTTMVSAILNNGAGGNSGALISGLVSDPNFLKFAAEKFQLDMEDFAIVQGMMSIDSETLGKLMGGDMTVVQDLNDEQRAALMQYQNLSPEKQGNIQALGGVMASENGIANALVLFSASQATELQSNEEFITKLNSLELKGSSVGGDLDFGEFAKIANGLAGGDLGNANLVQLLAEAPAAYGMSLCYGAYKEYVNETNENLKEGEEKITLLTYQDYIKSDEGKADLAAYVSCMNMINSNADDPEKVATLLIKGFGDLSGTLEEAMTE